MLMWSVGLTLACHHPACSFAVAPSLRHYATLKHVTKYYRRRTKDWGIVYWRDTPVDSRPAIPIESPIVDPSLPPFLSHDLLQLVGTVDAAHATDVTSRRSVTGLVFSLAGRSFSPPSPQAPLKLSSLGPSVPPRPPSTCVPFFGSVVSRKTMPLRSTSIIRPPYIAMINKRQPTARSRHVDFQHFAIQEWRQRGDIVMHHLPGVTTNNSDQLTKALRWTLHSRHAHRSMGHYGGSTY